METTITEKRRRIYTKEAPPGSANRDSDGGIDLISSLPDELLGTIISLLPTKDGACTQVISRRWQPLWRSAPLNLKVDHYLLGNQCSKGSLIISKVLASHRGPARRFLLPAFSFRKQYAEVDSWLHSQALNGLQEIDIGFHFTDPQPLPPSTLRFSPTLCVVKLSHCHFPNEMAPLLNFPCLKQLTLFWVTISEDALHSLLLVCPVLQSLSLEGNFDICRLCISSKTLRSISIDGPTSLWGEETAKIEELVIKDAPHLERLMPHGSYRGPGTIRVVQAPKLEISGLLPTGVCKLGHGITYPQEMIALSLTTSMQTVKILALVSMGPNLDLVVDFLKCFPCLEKLYVRSELQKTMKNERCYNALEPIECLERCLKKVVVKDYIGMKPDVDFAKFFVLNARVLKRMEFHVIKYCNNKWLASQHRQLQLENKASKGAEFEFESGFFNSSPASMYTHSLLKVNPFEIWFQKKEEPWHSGTLIRKEIVKSAI